MAKPLFANAVIPPTTTPSTTIETNTSLATESILKASTDENNGTSTHVEEAKFPRQTKPNLSTFASIITGGRSPEQTDETISEQEPSSPATVDESNSCLANMTEIIPAKNLKRKRRIEFIATGYSKQTVTARDDKIAAAAADDDQNGLGSTNNSNSSIGNNNNINSNSNNESKDIEDHGSGTATVASEDNSDAMIKLDICNLKDMLEAKVKFLCQDRPNVAPVQMIQIQLEV